MLIDNLIKCNLLPGRLRGRQLARVAFYVLACFLGDGFDFQLGSGDFGLIAFNVGRDRFRSPTPIFHEFLPQFLAPAGGRQLGSVRLELAGVVRIGIVRVGLYVVFVPANLFNQVFNLPLAGPDLVFERFQRGQFQFVVGHLRCEGGGLLTHFHPSLAGGVANQVQFDFIRVDVGGLDEWLPG